MSIKVINNQATCANLKRMLEEKGLTPNDVKEKLDLQSVQCVYKWFATANGKRCKGMPSMDNLFILASILDSTVDEIVILNDINI